MNVLRAALAELRDRRRRANEIGDLVNARILDQLLDVADYAGRLANCADRLYRWTVSGSLVDAAMRVQRQALYGLAPGDGPTDEVCDAIGDAWETVRRVNEEVTVFMALVAKGAPIEPLVLGRMSDAVARLHGWAAEQVTCQRGDHEQGGAGDVAPSAVGSGTDSRMRGPAGDR